LIDVEAEFCDDDDVFVCDLVTDLSAYLKHVVGLEYSERPNYQHCRGLFTKALKSVGAKPTDKLEFGPPPAAKSAPRVMLHFMHCVLIDHLSTRWGVNWPPLFSVG